MSLPLYGPVLFLDTCTPILQIALSRPSIDEDSLSDSEAKCIPKLYWQSQSLPCDSHHFHSSRMIPNIQALLNTASLKVSDLKAIAVNTGPGSFTGLRTGIVTARTLAQFLPIPIYAFNSLELYAQHAMHQIRGQNYESQHSNTIIAVYIDALRGRSFKAVYQLDRTTKNLFPIEAPQLTLLTEFPTRPGVPGVPSSKSLGLPRNTFIIASPTLHPWLQKHPFELTAPDDDLSTTLLMRNYLKSEQVENHRIAWENLSPLYLQEPSITLKPGFIPLIPSRLQID